MQWFRLYDEVLNDPKIQNLPENIFKFWVNLLCLANKHGGVLPDIDAISFALRVSKKKAEANMSVLEMTGLIDRTDNGLEPHNWKSRQYKSDSSADRMRRLRERKNTVTCDVTSTVTVTRPENRDRTDTETEQRAEQKPLADLQEKVLALSPNFLNTHLLQKWRGQGGTDELIMAVLSEKYRLKAVENLGYYDKAMQEVIACHKQGLPLPKGLKSAEKPKAAVRVV